MALITIINKEFSTVIGNPIEEKLSCGNYRVTYTVGKDYSGNIVLNLTGNGLNRYDILVEGTGFLDTEGNKTVGGTFESAGNKKDRRQIPSNLKVGDKLILKVSNGYGMDYGGGVAGIVHCGTPSNPNSPDVQTGGNTLNMEIVLGDTKVRHVFDTMVYREVFGDSGGCPTLDMNISVSPTETKPVGELKVGDMVYTRHQSTEEIGYYKVADYKDMLQPCYEYEFDNGVKLTVSESHSFKVNKPKTYLGYEELTSRNLSILDFSDSPVSVVSREYVGEKTVRCFEIEDAHTYVVNGIASHNAIGNGYGTITKRIEP